MSQNPTDDEAFAAEELCSLFLSPDDCIRAVFEETSEVDWKIPEVVRIITPGTGMTSGIVALFWCYMTGANRVVLHASSSDNWTPTFAEKLREVELADVNLKELDDQQLELLLDGTDVVVVYGSDKTCRRFKRCAPVRCKTVLYGSKISFCLLSKSSFTAQDVEDLAQDLSLYDGAGCLTPITIYVPKLGARVTEFLLQVDLRLRERFSDPEQRYTRYKFFEESYLEDWYLESIGESFVVRSASSKLLTTKGFGTAYVVEFCSLQEVEEELSMYPVSTMLVDNEAPRELIRASGASRIAFLGMGQRPSLSWKHDGQSSFLTLVDQIGVWDE
jgi:hypothetical protein